MHCLVRKMLKGFLKFWKDEMCGGKCPYCHKPFPDDEQLEEFREHIQQCEKFPVECYIEEPVESNIEDPVGFALEMNERNEMAERIWELLRTNDWHKKEGYPILLPYLNSYELPFYHLIGIPNDIHLDIELQCDKIQELWV